MSYRVTLNNIESDEVFKKKFPSKHHNTIPKNTSSSTIKNSSPTIKNTTPTPTYLISDSSIKPNPRIGDRIHIIKQNNNDDSASFGHILEVHRDGYYDVRLDNGTSMKRLPPSIVLSIPDVAACSEYTYLDVVTPQSASSPSSPYVSSLSSHIDQILPSFRRTEWRNSTQIEIDNNCTFSPKTNQSCPFISDRSIRDHIETNDNSNQDLIDEPIEIEIDEIYDEEISDYEEDKSYIIPTYGGMYIPGIGFSKGQPTEAGVNIYLYNENFPPLFDKGIYNKNMIIKKEIEVSKEVDNNINNTSNCYFPPQIPNWGWMNGGYIDNSTSKASSSVQEAKTPTWGGRSKTVVSSKDKESSKFTSGWGLIMEEMKRNNGLKKANNPHSHSKGAIPIKGNHLVKTQKKGKFKIVGKTIKHTRKFKNIMEEMKYTLAKLRGELSDDDVVEVDENENNSDIIKKEKENAKNDIIMTPLPSLLLQSTDVESLSISSSKTIESDTIIEKIPNNLKPARIFTNGIGLPAPPPIPHEWPYLAPYSYTPSKTIETTIVIKEEPTSLIENLPKGYYLPSKNIAHGQIIANGVTNTDLINLYQIPIVKIKKKISTIRKIKKIIKPSELKKNDYNNNQLYKRTISSGRKLTRDDLPLPPNFYDSIERMQRGQELRERKSKEVEPFLLRDYDESNTGIN
jgi:hypothetical protein